jgi:2-polyprenyl-3-methyl-5-hydroxy-6-metoxy-1,4-benzoquinol methylase
MTRDYNAETVDNQRKYAYSFDYDIMHPYMMKSFIPYFKAGAVLELGCFQGAFTQRLTEHFTDITCIEASSDAINAARQLPILSNVFFVESEFEYAELDRKFENILLVHVLEHLDDRVGLLKKIKDKWLADNGVFIVACPNAYAPSRQIAVHMGLIEYPEAVTPPEHAHGHRVTYSMETLENDILESGLSIIDSSGIFFKALANFQWDKLLETDIVSEVFFDGCYKLGVKYPDLCSSIFFVCKK